MKNLNQLEKQLESWIPRPPSIRVKQQLFGAAVAAPFPIWLKLAPVACVVLVVSFLCLPRREQVSYLAVSGSSNMLACLSSNLLTYSANQSSGGKENLWSGVTFDWTKDGVSMSTSRSFPTGKTHIQKL